MFRAFISFLVLFTGVKVLAVSYNLEVIYPDNEKKEFILGTERADIKLNAKKWKCEVTAVRKRDNGMESRSINCYGPSQTTVSSSLVCADFMLRNIMLDVSEGKKDYAMVVDCNK